MPLANKKENAMQNKLNVCKCHLHRREILSQYSNLNFYKMYVGFFTF